MPAVQETIDEVRRIDVDQYKYGFETEIETDKAPKGLSEDIIRFISEKKDEPGWMLEWRLAAFRRWLTLEEPTWARVDYPRIDFQDIHYYAAPKNQSGPRSLSEVDPELLKVYEKLGIPLKEQEILAGVKAKSEEDSDEAGLVDTANDNVYKSGRVAVDAVFDSISVVTTFKEELARAGVIFCSISEAIREHPELVRKYLGSVVPVTDNFYATLNSAVFTDGSFVFVPKGVRCPMELSTYFRINERNTGQFERTLIIAEEGAYVSYLEGCTAPQRDENQLHAAVVELIALDDAEIKYSTVQNWYPGDAQGKGGIYNFVTKRGDCRGDRSKISWTQVETGSAITWKYPSCILRGDDSRGEFYSIAVSNGHQQVDSGTKMLHLGKNTSSSHHLQGNSGGVLAEHLSRPGLGPSQGLQRPQLHQLRQPADRRSLRRPHRALHRGQERHGQVRARGDHLEDIGRPEVLRDAARHPRGTGDRADRQRLRQGGHPGAADGVRGRGAEADRDQPGGQRWLTGRPPAIMYIQMER